MAGEALAKPPNGQICFRCVKPLLAITLWQLNIAIEIAVYSKFFPLEIVIFHSYISLPEDDSKVTSPRKGAQLPPSPDTLFLLC